MNDDYQLSKGGKELWKKTIKRWIYKSTHNQDSLAATIGSSPSEMSKFVNGDPRVLQKWFEAKRKILEDMTKELGKEPDDFEKIRQEALGVKGPPPGQWHPEFPGIRQDEMTIDDCFVLGSGQRQRFESAKLVTRELDLEKKPRVVLRHEPGRRRTLALQCTQRLCIN